MIPNRNTLFLAEPLPENLPDKRKMNRC